jgi:hypothetical protein
MIELALDHVHEGIAATMAKKDAFDELGATATIREGLEAQKKSSDDFCVALKNKAPVRVFLRLRRSY